MDANSPDSRDILPKGYTFHWYEIVSVLGRGAFGVTYLAKDKNLDRLVAVKEYFPIDFATRETSYTVHPTQGEHRDLYQWGLDRFIKEARTLAKFKHANIVQVLSVFEHNNTAYMVMEYEHGSDLSRIFKSSQHQSQQRLLDIFLPIIDGLKLIHDAGFIHRDIKPSNIYIRNDGSPVLIDFGSARQVANALTQSVTTLVTRGYAPFEQFNEGIDKQGPWTDIYSLGACLYLAVAGNLPIDALARGSSLLSRGVDPYERLSNMTLTSEYTQNFLRAIDHALLFHAADRPQDATTWANMLSGRTDAPPLPISQGPRLAEVEEATILLNKSTKDYTAGRGNMTGNSQNDTASRSSGRYGQSDKPETNSAIISISKVAALFIAVLAVGSVLYMIFTGSYKHDVKDTQRPVASALKETVPLVMTPAPAVTQELKNKAQKENLDAGASVLPPNTTTSKDSTSLVMTPTPAVTSELNANHAAGTVAPPARTGASNVATDITALLSTAERQRRAQHLLEPVGDNAYETYKKILQLAPGNIKAETGIAAIAQMLLEQAEEQERRGALKESLSSLEQGLRVAPWHGGLRAMLAKVHTEIETIKNKNNSSKEATPDVARKSNPHPKTKQSLREPQQAQPILEKPLAESVPPAKESPTEMPKALSTIENSEPSSSSATPIIPSAPQQQVEPPPVVPVNPVVPQPQPETKKPRIFGTF